ncbi:MAG: hypothetical protein ABIF17_01540 [Patescibacteria group bacterium]
MLNKKVLSIIVILLLVAVIVLAVFLIIKNKNQQSIVEASNLLDDLSIDVDNQNLPAEQAKKPSENFIRAELSEQEKEQGFLLKTSSAFAERFGSYSNQSNYENLIDLKYFMTLKMQKEVDSKLANRDFTKSNNIYYGVTTRTLSTEIISMSNMAVVVKLKTQREEFWGADTNSKVSYRDILINFIKEGGVWKINSANWQ